MKKFTQLTTGVRLVLRTSLLQVWLSLSIIGIASGFSGKAQELLERRITLKAADREVKKVLSDIEKAANTRFVYSAQIVDARRKISFNASNERLSEVLDRLLTPLKIGYELSGKQIILVKKPEIVPETSKTGAISEPAKIEVAVAEISLSGKVTDEKGDGLPGVNVVIKNTTRGVTTNVQGDFQISVPDQNSVLVFSFVGFQSQEITVGTASKLTIKLLADTQALGEVVVIGYGTQSRGNISGAISSIGAQDLVRTPAVTTSGALVGKIQGITARQADARPGASTTIQVRNMGTPLFVIDGVPADAGQFNNLGQSDIENISILKDASASIYGLRAANGVVLVTTKKGRVGKPAINLSAYYGIQKFTRYPKPANAYQHVRALAESDQNRGIKTTITPEELEKWRVGTEKGFQSFDYYDMVMSPNVPQFSLNASASGGSENVNYFISATHLDQAALIEDYKFSRTNFQANIDAGLSKGLRVGTQLSGRIEFRHQTGVPGLDDYFNPFLSIFTMWPTERPYANDNPKYINQTHNVNVNPATYKEEVTGYIDEYWRAIKGNFYAQYDFNFGLQAKATYSYNFTNFDFNGFEYTYDAYTYDAKTDTYNVVPGGGNQNPWRERRKRNVVDRFLQFQLTYNKKIGDHGLSAVAAYERSDTDNKYLVVHTVPPNNYVPIQYFANQDLLIDTWDVIARAGYIGRVNYNFKQKYLLEAVGRYDGSFLFAPGKRYGFFPGVSAGWRMMEEPFFKNSLGRVVDDLKLRVSWGKTGADLLNDAFIVAPFSYLPGYTWAPTTGANAVFNGNLVTGIQPRGLPITSLSWINNITKNIGIDFSLFNGKLTGEFDAFERRRNGLPAARYDVLLPSEVGYTLPQENLNSDATRGIEGILTHRGTAKGVQYSIGVNATLARVRDISQYKPRFGNAWDEYRNSRVDRWANINWGYQVLGQFQSQQEIDEYKVDNDGQGNRTQLPGDFIYKDVNGDGHINNLDERPIGYAEGANPYLSFGINGSLAYKGFSLLVDFAGGNFQSFRREVEMKIPFQNNGTSPAYMFEDRWHRADPFNVDSPWIAGTFPAVRKDSPSHNNYNKRTDFWTTNVRYIRLRNVELGYTIPQLVTKKFGVSTLRVYVNGTNLFSIDNLRKYQIDPEVSSNGALVYPQQRLFNTGINVTF